MFHYVQLDGKSIINKNDKKIESIATPSDCASQCDKSNGIQCKSFNYCPNSKYCYLSENHLDESTPVNPATDLVCEHYSSELFF